MTTSCSNCQRYCGLINEGPRNVFRMYDLARDGFTVTDIQHKCGESDRRHA